MNQEQDRRRFHRFPFHADCALQVDETEEHPCELLDLSINGALVQLGDAAEFEAARPGHLALRLRGLTDGSRAEMVLGVHAVRVEEGRIACRFVQVDPASFEQLKDMIAANLGDLAMLDRELTQLDYWPGLSISPDSD